MMYWGSGHAGSGWGFAMMLAVPAVLVLITLAVGWFIWINRAPAVPTTGAAQRLLDEQLARGAISIDDYTARSAVLTTHK